jgi:hypothetical protein
VTITEIMRGVASAVRASHKCRPDAATRCTVAGMRLVVHGRGLSGPAARNPNVNHKLINYEELIMIVDGRGTVGHASAAWGRCRLCQFSHTYLEHSDLRRLGQ